jgi:hypothetical protein
LRDLDLFKRFQSEGIPFQIGATLTCDNKADSLRNEPGGAVPDDRLKALEILHKAGFRTWASFEPVLSPEQSLHLMQQGAEFIDYYKVGKLNHQSDLEALVDWRKFLIDSLELCRGMGKPIYIKDDLAKFGEGIQWEGNERDKDAFAVGYPGRRQTITSQSGLIYVPGGPAREYSPLAVNVYNPLIIKVGN